MKLAINAASAKMGGAVTYLTSLLRWLPPAASGHEFVIFLPARTAEKLDPVAGNVKLVVIPTEQGGRWKRLRWEQLTLRGSLRKLGMDALFSTANFGMFRCPVRQVLLVRNHLYFSQIWADSFLPQHGLKFRLAFRARRWLCCQSVRWADAVMAPTRAMMDDLRQYVDVPARKAIVNHYGVSAPTERRTARLPAAGTPGAVRLLYVSLYAEHKNLATLLKALPILNREGKPAFELVTTANPDWEGARWTRTRKMDSRLAKQPDIAPWVRFAGPLGPKAIEERYRRAEIAVYPSLSESFGHPLAEAMAHGLPIVAADTRVNREICGDAAVFFRPLEPADLAGKIVRVASSEALREKLRREGRERASELFRWDEHVRRILEIAQVRPSPRHSPAQVQASQAQELQCHPSSRH